MDDFKQCPECGSAEVLRKGYRKLREGKSQILKCKACGRKFSIRPDNQSLNPTAQDSQ
jgi:transposase-like protein